MKNLTEYITLLECDSLLGDIILELDEASFALLDDETIKRITESNREIARQKEGRLLIGDHATQRQDRPVEKGGDGKHINEYELIYMFKYAWKYIMEMIMKKEIDPYDSIVSSFVIKSNAYITYKDGKLVAEDARPADQTLWAAFMVRPNEYTGKTDITIKTIFRGASFKHSYKQRRIEIMSNGFVKKIKPNY